ncbi:uncharacterized protein [Clytia hemisphaerica]|uniref:protein-tyrosine-phosphatase n=1 Tax=Clytia hemisphaerica TaxID=252671 RepID=A0A7M5V5F9_9CNID|eukprot:TCONS_00009502-protein
MKTCVIFFLILNWFALNSDQKPLQHEVTNEALYAKEILTKLLQNAMFREMLSDHLERSFTDDNEPRSLHMLDSDILPESTTLVLNVSENWFLLHKWKFLKDLENLIANQDVRCQISHVHSSPRLNVVVEFFCHYKQSHKMDGVLYVPAFKLLKLLESSKSRDFIKQYNISFPMEKVLIKDRTTSLSTTFIKSIWFPITTGIMALVVLIVIGFIILSCCRKRVSEGEKVGEPALKNHKPNEEELDSFMQSNTTPSKNSFVSSPKKHLFSYSPSKFSTPVFSFTSPKKHKDKLVYPNSPIETAPPLPVQPQLGLLYPSSLNSTGIRKSSANSSGNSTEKSRTPSLLQSRRGSSASLIIDVSPRTPPRELSIPSHESPTEEILQRKSRCLRFRDLRMAFANDKELHEEFWGIPPNTVGRKDITMKYSLKNRYSDILPNAKSIVSLRGDGRKDSSSKYINANFIRGYDGIPDQFVATQGPLPCTVIDFWHMVWQYRATAIVMITKLKEKNREKCVQYWPSPGTTTQSVYGDITVTFESEEHRDGYTVISLNISHKGQDEHRKILHYWFTAWPDHHVPKSCTQVVSLAEEVIESHQHTGLPIVVHCSAGRGRTGCFIAIFNGIVQINEDNRVDILKIVSQMRIQRGGMVAKDHQYKFIYNALHEYWSKKLQLSPTLSRFSLDDDMTEHSDPDEDIDGDYSYTLHHAFSFAE